MEFLKTRGHPGVEIIDGNPVFFHHFRRDGIVFGDIAKGALTLRPSKPKAQYRGDAAIEAMKYALNAEEGMEFLRCWMHGDFGAIRKEWPDAPESVFVGAGPALDK